MIQIKLGHTDVFVPFKFTLQNFEKKKNRMDMIDGVDLNFGSLKKKNEYGAGTRV